MICPMPFTHLNIKPDKTLTACWRCQAVLGDYTKQSLNEAWNSDTWKEFRQQHINNERPEGCRSCWEMEDAGVESTRQIAIREGVTSDYLLEPPSPQDIEIRFGNLCNLQCRHCSQKFSSKWMNSIKKNPELKRLLKEIDGLPSSLSVNELPDTTINELQKMASNLKMIRITGGEPLMHPMHYDMLDAFSTYEKNITLDYNTNLHYLSYKGKNISDYWKKYKKVICRVSIDADESTYNYIRYNGDIKKLKENWKILQNQLEEQITTKQFELYATCTINVLNVVRIEEVFKFFKSLGSRFHISFVQYPRALDIAELPDNLKINIKQQCNNILSQDISAYHKNSIRKIIKWIDKPSKINFSEQFVKWIRAQDNANGDCIFNYYQEFDYLKELYYE